MNGYDLSRAWFNFSFENPEKIKPIHGAIFFFAIEHCNRLGGKEKFGFPSQMTMDAIGIKKYQTYGKALNDLAEWGFITFIEKSKNQYSANIISINAVPKKAKARGKALDKATIKHGAKQGRSIGQGTVSINKPINQEPINQELLPPNPQGGLPKKFNFKNELLDLGANGKLVDEWLKIRRSKKGVNSKKALEDFITEVRKAKISINDALGFVTDGNRQWRGFKAIWYENEKKDRGKEKSGFYSNR